MFSYIVFLFLSICNFLVLLSLTCCLFRSMLPLFNFQNLFLLFFSNFIPLWLEIMLYILSIFKKNLEVYFIPSICSVLENVPHKLESNIYSAAFGWCVPYISSSRFICCSFIYLLIFCLIVPSVTKGDIEIFNSDCYIVYFSL